MSTDFLLYTNDFDAAEREIQDAGGRITQHLTDYVFVAVLPENVSPDSLQHAQTTPLDAMDEVSNIMAESWSNLQAKRADQASDTEGLQWDAEGYDEPRTENTYPEIRDGIADGEEGEQQAPLAGAGTAIPANDALMGTVAVGVVIVSGTDAKPQYQISASEKATIISEVKEALTWYTNFADYEIPVDLHGSTKIQSMTNLKYVYDIQFVEVDATPCSDPDKSTYEQCEAPWRDPALQKLGYGTGQAGINAYVTALKKDKKADAAYVSFFTKYPVHWFAYASKWSHRLVMAYSNDGWGPNQINRVFAHESGHIFGADDEYGSCSCGDTGGYLNVRNGNCVNCSNHTHVACLMDSNTLNMCQFTRGQIGWGWVIVGGFTEMTDVGQSKPYVVSQQWGQETPLKVPIGSGRTYSEQYGDNSLGYYYVYMMPMVDYMKKRANGEKVPPVLVGGYTEVRPDRNSSTSMQRNAWGKTTSDKVIVSAGLTYEGQYNPSGQSWGNSYGYLDANFNPTGDRVIIGGRFMVTNDTSRAEFIMKMHWGWPTKDDIDKFREKHEVLLGANYTVTAEYGSWSYSYMNFYLSDWP